MLGTGRIDATANQGIIREDLGRRKVVEENKVRDSRIKPISFRELLVDEKEEGYIVVFISINLQFCVERLLFRSTSSDLEIISKNETCSFTYYKNSSMPLRKILFHASDYQHFSPNIRRHS